MAHFNFKTHMENANDIVFAGRRVDFRPKDKNVHEGDTISYTVVYNKKEIEHPINKKTYVVTYKDGKDPRVMRDYDALCITELRAEWE